MNPAKKKLYVPAKYIAYDSVSYINQIAKPLFDRYDIIFVDFARIFYDSSWLFFTSHSGVTQYLFDSGFVFLPYVDIQKQQSFCLLSSIDKFRSYMSEVKENFQVDNLFAYIDKHDKYIDVYWFGAKANQPGIIDFYINHLDLLKSYAEYFKDKASDLINDSEKNRIYIPNNFKQDYEDAFNKIQKISNQGEFTINGQYIYITPREMQCLKLAVKGLTAKMIAKELSLSHRTVETHLEKAKFKLNCDSKKNLIKFIFKYLYEPSTYQDEEKEE